MVAAQKWAHAKTKQATTTKWPRHDFWNSSNDDDEDSVTEDSDIDKTKIMMTTMTMTMKKSTIIPENNVVVQPVSGKNNVTTGIADLLLDDALATELPGTLEATIKNV